MKLDKTSNYFSGKTIWITGASSGIGRGFALVLSTLGAYVIISSRRKSVLEEVKLELAHPDQCLVIPLDMEDFKNIDNKTEEILAMRKIDMVILNAGISQRERAINTSFETELKIFTTNFLGLTRFAKPILKQMSENESGHVIVMSSVTGKIGVPGRSSYAASKHALHGYFDSVRAELDDRNIFVTILCPGYVHTNISLNAVKGDGQAQQSLDDNSKNGMNVDVFVSKALKGIAKKKPELLIGGKETFGVILKRFFPRILFKIVKNIDA